MSAGSHPARRWLGRGLRGESPNFLLVALVVAALINVACVGWLCVAAENRSPATYVEDQLELWLRESRRHPDSPLAWVTLGGLYAELGQPEEAAHAYDTALALDATNPAALLSRAERDQAAGDYESARTHIFRAIEQQPAWSAYRSWYRLGLLEESAGRPEQALAAYEAATSLCRTCWRSHYRMALLYEQRGDAVRARTAISEAHRYAPGDPEVLEAWERLASAQ